MNFFDKFILKRAAKINNSTATSSTIEMNEFFLEQYKAQYGADISEITYFICVKTLSEALAKLPLHLIDANKNYIEPAKSLDSYMALCVRPNYIQNPIEFFTYLEYCRNHFGNAYAYINRNTDGTIEGLYPLWPQYVTIWVNDTQEFTSRHYYYKYADPVAGKEYWLRPDDVLHVKAWICERNGLAGKSVREILAEYMTGNKASQKVLNDLCKNGLTANAVVNYLGEINTAKKTEMLRQMNEIATTSAGRVIPLPYDWKLQPLDMKLVDAQFYELKKYSGLQVAAAFGIKPNSINDYSKSSYANSAAQNLSFYVETLLYNLTLYEQEMKRKLLTTEQILQQYEWKFNVNVILRGDPVQQSQVIKNYVTGATYRINEARRLADQPPVPDGDQILIPSGYMLLSDFINQQKSLNQNSKGG